MSSFKLVFVRVRRLKDYRGYKVDKSYVVEARWDNWCAANDRKWMTLGYIEKHKDARQWESRPDFGEVGHDCIETKWDAVQDVVDIAREHDAIP